MKHLSLKLQNLLFIKNSEVKYLEKYETNKIRCCYYNSVENFLKEDEENWLKTMCNSFNSLYHLPLKEPQEKAWRDCFKVLQNELVSVNNKYPGLQIIFEYL